MTVRPGELAALAAAIEHVRGLDSARRHEAVRVLPRASGDGPARPRVRRRRRVRATCAACARSKRSPRPTTRASSRSRSLVRELGRSLRDLEPALTAADGIWLRAFKSRLHNALPPAVAADLPDWLWERLGAAYGEATRRRSRARGRSPAPFDLRVNPSRRRAKRRWRRSPRKGFAGDRHALLAARPARRRPAVARQASVARGRPARSAGRRQPARRLSRRAAAQRHGRRLLRGRRRQDAAARRADALAGTAVCVRRRRQAPRQAQAAARALGAVERASAADRARARHEDQAPRRQDRSRAGRRAVHRLRHAAPQSRSQVAAAGIGAWPSSRRSRRRSSPRRRRS